MILSSRVSIPKFLITSIVVILLFSGFITNFLSFTGTGLSTIIIDVLFFLLLLHLLLHIIHSYYSARKIDRTYFTLATLWLLLFLCSILKLLFFDNNPLIERILGLRNNIIYASLILYIPLIIKKQKDLQLIFNVLLSTGLLLVVFSIFQFIFSSQLPISLLVLRGEGSFGFYGTSIVRPTALIGNTIIYASFTIFLFSAYLAKYIYSYKKKHLLITSLIALANILTFTRATLAGMLLVCLIIIFFRYGKFTVTFIKKIIAILFTIIVSILLLGYIFQDSFIVKRVTGVDSSTQSSTNVHVMQIINSIEYLKDNYLTGAGIGSQGASGASENKIVTDGYWYQLFLENGVVLGLFYFLFYGLCVFYAIKVFYKSDNIWLKQLCITFVASSAYFFCASFLNSAFAGRANFIVFWLIFGLLVSQNIIEKKERPWLR